MSLKITTSWTNHDFNTYKDSDLNQIRSFGLLANSSMHLRLDGSIVYTFLFVTWWGGWDWVVCAPRAVPSLRASCKVRERRFGWAESQAQGLEQQLNCIQFVGKKGQAMATLLTTSSIQQCKGEPVVISVTSTEWQVWSDTVMSSPPSPLHSTQHITLFLCESWKLKVLNATVFAPWLLSRMPWPSAYDYPCPTPYT